MALECDELKSAITLRIEGKAAGNSTASPAAAAASAAPGAAAAAPAAAAPPAPGGKKDKKAEKGEKAPKPVKEKPQWGVPGSGKAKKEAAKEKNAKEQEVIVVPDTPVGEKKDMSCPMLEAYHPKVVESAWSTWWEKKGFFTPDAVKSKGTVESKRFIMVIPPPNVTGSLHLGHTLTCAIEDALTRWHRMCGNVALWVPGTDHAGIATQSVVERLLYKREGLTRHDLGRDKFLERVWNWKEANGNRICHQLRSIAASVDWSRERFTMDSMLNKAVVEAFIRFHEKGLIYRANRLVHWCPHLGTALSDVEVDHEDIPGRTLLTIPGYGDKVEVGVLCQFKYFVKGTKDSLTVATTRLETMLGDTGVAVHPEDDRYKAYVGKELEHPFFADRKMVIVADPTVEKDFGTGAVKITPAHDHTDFKRGKQFGLGFINCFNENGTICDWCGEFAGQHRFEARKTVEEALKKLGHWVDKKEHAMRLGFCSRSKDIIEPFMMPQWWMDCKDLAEQSVNAVKEKKLKILPDFHHQTWFHWLENIQEWCISRQLWWGHRIPAYKVVEPPQPKDKEVWVSAKNMEEAEEKAKAKLGVTKVKLVQDEDVLDTWFSSGLFPFSVFNWPECGDDFDAFFPTSLLETGHDILFFWVARMVMMSLGLTGKLPFHTVYLHAMVRDAHGKKMSKSSGNVIDPIEVIEGISLEDLHAKLYQGNLPDKEIERAKEVQKKDYPKGLPECGADALRFGLLAYTLQGRSVNLDVNRVVGYRQFCNKVWQGCRFGLKYFGSDFKFRGSLRLDAKYAFEDKWILSKLSGCAEKANLGFEEYQFANSTTAAYTFFYEFCDVYLELLKPRMQGEDTDENKEDRSVAREVLYIILDWSLRLMHPMLPYVTEELYQRLPFSPIKHESICIAPYPKTVLAWKNDIIEDSMEVLKEIAGKFRSQKVSVGFAPGATPRGFVRHSDPDVSKKITTLAPQLARMAGMSEIQVVTGEKPSRTLQDVVNKNCFIFTEVEGLDLNGELAKLKKKIESTKNTIKTYEDKASKADYADKVPEDIRKMNAEKLEAARVEQVGFLQSVKDIEEAMKA